MAITTMNLLLRSAYGAGNGTIGCWGDRIPFTVDLPDMLYGYAALENVTTTASKSMFSNKKEGAIDVGVGVPLGVIAASAIAWAISKRLQRRKALDARTGPAMATGAAAAPTYWPVLKTDFLYACASESSGAGAVLVPMWLEQRLRPIPEPQGSQRM